MRGLEATLTTLETQDVSWKEGTRVLVLSRKKDESIIIGDIVVTVKEVRGNRVKLGIQAPGDVKILRMELVLNTETGEVEPEAEQPHDTCGGDRELPAA